MLIQYFSDLHLEWFKKGIQKFLQLFLHPQAPVLVLAGDIGNPFDPLYAEFLYCVSVKFQKVFLVSGNHEYYGHTVDEADSCICNVVHTFPNVSYLNNSSEDYEGYRFVGSTFWSYVTDDDLLTNDFLKIKGMTTSAYNDLHQKARQFVLAEQKNAKDKKLVVITHHLPSSRLVDPIYAHSPFQHCFSSASDDLISRPVVCWFYGHTHRRRTDQINGVSFYCNPVGYPGENTTVTLNICAQLD